jgi:hypothetical protein
VWAPANAALEALQRAVTTVAITGPDRMADLAATIHEEVMAKANTMRMPAAAFDDRVRRYAEHSANLEEARRSFIREARAVLSTPGE